MTNERTKQLVDQFAQDLLTASGYDMREFSPFLTEAEKFALFIVQKCMFAVENHGGMCGATSSKKIKDHFGI